MPPRRGTCLLAGLLTLLATEWSRAAEPAWWSGQWYRLIDAASEELLADQGVSSFPPAPAPSTHSPIIPSDQPIVLEGVGSASDPDQEEPEEPPDSATVFTYLPGSGDELGIFSLDFKSTSGTSLRDPSIQAMQTGWGITWLTGPHRTDLPPQLYHLTFSFDTLMRVREDDWLLDIALIPGWYTDWENRRPESFRLTGRAVMYYRLDDRRHFGGGLLYLNRDDIPALPFVGLVIKDDAAGYAHDLVFPRPRLSWRITEPDPKSWWVYLLGELGGGSWAIKRFDRTPDVVTLRDLHVMAGLEHRRPNGARAMWEAGYVFERAVRSRTGRGDYDPSDAFQVRCWFEY
jgi:hypothetical protein